MLMNLFLGSYLNSLSTLSLSFSLKGGCLFVSPFLFLLSCTHSAVSPLSLPFPLLGALWVNHYLFTSSEPFTPLTPLFHDPP